MITINGLKLTISSSFFEDDEIKTIVQSRVSKAGVILVSWGAIISKGAKGGNLKILVEFL